MISLKTLNIITCIWIAAGIITFPLLLKITQPYGRHVNEKWGPMIGNKLGWIIQESPSMIFLSIFFFTGSGVKSHAALFFWALWVLHYINRSIIFNNVWRDCLRIFRSGRNRLVPANSSPRITCQ